MRHIKNQKHYVDTLYFIIKVCNRSVYKLYKDNILTYTYRVDSTGSMVCQLSSEVHTISYICYLINIINYHLMPFYMIFFTIKNKTFITLTFYYSIILYFFQIVINIYIFTIYLYVFLENQ